MTLLILTLVMEMTRGGHDDDDAVNGDADDDCGDGGSFSCMRGF